MEIVASYGNSDYFSYDWNYTEYRDNTEIHCCAVNNKGERCLIRILGFPQFVWLLFDKKFIKRYRRNNIILQEVDRFLRYLKLGYTNYNIEQVIEPYKSLILTDANNSQSACKITFNKPSECAKFCYAYNIKVEAEKDRRSDYIIPGKILEKDINYILRMICYTNMEYSCWFNFQPYEYVDQISILPREREFVTYYSEITKIDSKLTLSWIPPLPICSFDAETFSSQSSQDAEVFPDMTNISDEIYVLSFVYELNGFPQNRQRYAFLVGDCSKINDKEIIVYHYETEYEMIIGFCEFLVEMDIAIITGYNILKFDIPYMNMRLLMRDKEWPHLSIIEDQKTDILVRVWSSAAYGDVESNTINVLGLVNIDLYPIIERTYKLPNYTLKYIAKYFLNEDEKIDLSYSEQFSIYRQRRDATTKKQITKANKLMADTVLYCIQDSELIVNLINKLGIIQVITSLSCITFLKFGDIFAKGQQIRTYSVLYKYCSSSNIIIEKPINIDYHFKGGHVVDPITGYHDTSIAVYDFNSLYPTIMISNNLCYSTFIDERTAKAIDIKYGENHNKYSVYKIPLDDEENTTNILITRFLKRDAKVGILCDILTKFISERKKVRAPISSLKKELSKITDIIKEDPSLEDTYSKSLFDINTELKNRDSIQLAFKVVCNSAYGFTGTTNKNGIMPLKAIAITVTYLARKYLNVLSDFCKNTIGHENFIMVYGDTDSVMVRDIRLKLKESFKKYKQFETYINEGLKKGQLDYNGNLVTEDTGPLFPRPMKIELEKCCAMILITKKNYAMVFREENGDLCTTKDDEGNIIFDIQWRGLPPAKKGTCNFLRKIYVEICNLIFKGANYLDCLKCLFRHVNNLLSDNIDYEDLIIMSKFGNPTSDTAFSSVFMNELAKRGKIFVPGDRVRWFIADLGDKDLKKGYKARLYSELIESNKTNNPFKPDIFYYIDNVLKKRLDTLFKVVFAKELDLIYQKPYYRFEFKAGRCDPRTLYTPVEIIGLCIKYEIKVSSVEKMITSFIENYYNFN